MTRILYTVLGELASKSNSRQVVKRGGLTRVIKSEKALQYEQDFMKQVGRPTSPLQGDVVLTVWAYYASRRPDLDESLLMDCIQRRGILENDRQIKEKHVYWGLDPKRPRVTFEITLLQKEEKKDA